MSETKHSPEPWAISGTLCLVSRKTGRVLWDSQTGCMSDHADLDRIVACVNACAGIPTEALESGALKHVIDLAAWPYEGEHGSRCDEHEEGCPDCEMVAALVAIGRLK